MAPIITYRMPKIPIPVAKSYFSMCNFGKKYSKDFCASPETFSRAVGAVVRRRVALMSKFFSCSGLEQPSKRRWWYIRYCPPPFAEQVPFVGVCGLRKVCPFCWCRSNMATAVAAMRGSVDCVIRIYSFRSNSDFLLNRNAFSQQVRRLPARKAGVLTFPSLIPGILACRLILIIPRELADERVDVPDNIMSRRFVNKLRACSLFGLYPAEYLSSDMMTHGAVYLAEAPVSRQRSVIECVGEDRKPGWESRWLRQLDKKLIR